MSALIMTLSSDDEEGVGAGDDDDIDDFSMRTTDGLVDPSQSGRWATARARSDLVPRANAGAALERKLAERAAENAARQPAAPALRPEEEGELRERQPKGGAAKKAEAKRAKEAASKSKEAEEEEGASDPLTSVAHTTFDALNLSKPLLKAVWELGYVSPTPIQSAVMPPAMRGLDICASAVTGSGKTAAFLLPALERLVHRPRRIAATRVLVLCPTRELAAQCEEMGRQLGRFTDVRFALVVGGLSVKAQEVEIRSRPDVLVATPGRLIDLLRNSPSVGLDEVDILVLDEADRMLDIGFEQEVSEVVNACPPGRQTMLFSATISSSVAKLAKLSLSKPLQVKVDPLFNVADSLQQEFVRLRPSKEHEREAVLLSLVTRTFTSRAIVFLASKKLAHRVKVLFGLFGLKAAELHGNLTQQQRLQALDDFREGTADFLLATDLAGRGLDIRGVTTVINFELPTELKTYIHRVGRTARAGSDGRAVSIVAERDRAFVRQVLKHAPDVVRTRSVPPESIAHWVERIGGVEDQVAAVLQEEAEEKAIRVAEMEANKASNLMAHHDEIMARPARSWFQTETEKQAVKDAVRRQNPTAAAMSEDAEAAGAEGEADAWPKKGAKGGKEEKKREIKRDKYAGMSRQKRRALQRKEMFDADAAQEGGPSVILPNQKAIARGAKSAAKRGPRGIPAGLVFHQAEKRAAGSEAAGAKKKQKTSAPAGSNGGGSEGAGLATARSPGATLAPGSLAGLGKSAGGASAAKAKAAAQRTIPKKTKSHSKPKFSKARKRK